MPRRKGQKVIGLTNMQLEVLKMFKELGGASSSYGVILHAKRTRPTYGRDSYFALNMDNRIAQLKKRGYLKYDASDGKWHLLKKEEEWEGIHTRTI